jgi:hypothetical protein
MLKILVRFQVLTAASMMFRIVFWDVLPCKIIVDQRFRGAYCLRMRIIRDDGKQYAPLERRPTIILHGSTSQKTILNITKNSSYSLNHSTLQTSYLKQK